MANDLEDRVSALEENARHTSAKLREALYRLDSVNCLIGEVHTRMARVEGVQQDYAQKFNVIESRFSQIDERVDQIETRIEQILQTLPD